MNEFEITFKQEKLQIATHFRQDGDELIVFIHGLGCAKESFNGAWESKVLKKYSLLAIDLVGHGNSSHSEVFSYTMDDQAAVVCLLMQRMQHEKIHLVAHSMGGAIGLMYVRELGERLKSFTSVEGNLIAEDCGALSRKTASMSLEDFSGSFYEELRQFGASSDESGWRAWVEWTRKCSPLAFHKSAASLVQVSDSGELLKTFQALEVKKAYVYGDKNKEMPILAKLGDISRIEIPESGHFPMIDNPLYFYENLSQVVA